eukprot:7601646-Ditylum_brightwellii.AAC.1
MAAEDIWGPDLGCLQGKTVQCPGVHARPITLGIPPCIIEQYMNVLVTADIITINRMQFLYPYQED